MSVESDGHCLVRASWVTLCVQGAEYTFDELMTLAAKEFTTYPILYNIYNDCSSA